MKFYRKIIQLFKRLVLSSLPIYLLHIYKKNKYDKKKIEIRDKAFSKLNNQEIFSIIYKKNCGIRMMEWILILDLGHMIQKLYNNI